MLLSTHLRYCAGLRCAAKHTSDPSPLALSLDRHQGLFNKPALHIRYWSFTFSISPSNEYPGLISFRIAWVDGLAVEETLERLFQSHSLKVSVLQCSPFFMVQSHVHTPGGSSFSGISLCFFILFMVFSRQEC